MNTFFCGLPVALADGLEPRRDLMRQVEALVDSAAHRRGAVARTAPHDAAGRIVSRLSRPAAPFPDEAKAQRMRRLRAAEASL